MMKPRLVMARLHGTWLALIYCLFASVVVGCDCRGGQAPVASLVERQGDVVRDTSSSVGKWKEAPLGAKFEMGDGVWLRGSGRAVLGLGRGQSLAMRPDSVVRFGSQAGMGEQFSVQEGEAVLVVEDKPLTLTTEFGVATFGSNSRIVIGHSDKGMQFSVELGSAKFQSEGKEEVIASVGDAVIVGPSVLDLVDVAKDAVEEGRKADETPQPDSDESGEYVVELARAGGSVRYANEENFQELSKGSHRVAAGSTLRLPRDVSAKIQFGNQVVSAQGGAEYELGQGEVGLQAGRLEVQTADKPVRLRVPGGFILVEAPEGGSKAGVQVKDTGTDVDVQRGQARVQIGDEEQVLEGGMAATIPLPEGEEDETGLGQFGPAQVELVAAAGRTFYVHTTKLPVAVGLSASSRCKTGAVAKLSSGATFRGGQQVNLSLAAGRHGYAMHCIQDGKAAKRVVARGTIMVLRDSGTRQLPKEAPATQVDADGRLYTVIYQNQSPRVTFRWPKAPSSPSYTLTVRHGSSERTYKDKTASHVFASGTLRDGQNDMYYTLPTGRRSPMTTVEVNFDNSAPKASVSEPQERGFAVGDSVTISGMALPGWKVSVEGGTIDIDSHNRFTGRVQTTIIRPQVTLQLSHPRKGVHYYLRHAASE